MAKIVTPAIRKTYGDLIDQVIEDLHKPITAHMPPDKEDCPNCFEAGTLIDTPSGFKTIEDFAIGDLVYDGLGNVRRVNHVFHRRVKTEFTTIKLHGNSLGISATSNHKIPVYDNLGSPYIVGVGNKHEKPIGGIRAGELVSHNIRKLPEECLNSFNFDWKANKYGPKKELNEEIFITDDFLFAYGLYLAEGCTSKGRQVQYCLNKQELEEGERVCEYWKSLLNINYSICSRKKSEENAVFELYSSHLADFMDRKCGHLAQNKFICPELYYKLNKEQTLVLIDALFFGDGHIEKELNSKVLGITSKVLSLQVYNLLLSCGYQASIIYTPEKEGKDGVLRQPVYSVRFWDDNNFELRGTKKSGDNLFLVVKEVTKDTRETEVFNLEVDVVHSYSADSIVVNNCIYDRANKKSSNTFDSSFVAPVSIFGSTISPQSFTRGRCPVCYGAGVLTNADTRSLKALVKWNPRRADVIERTPAGREGAPVVRIKLHRENFDILVGAESFTVDGVKCELIEPPTIRGLGTQEEMVVAFLLAVEVGSDVKR